MENEKNAGYEALYQSRINNIRSASEYFEPEETVDTIAVEAPIAKEEELPTEADPEEPQEQDPLRSPSLTDSERCNSKAAYTSLRFLSCLYALVLIVLGMAFPLSEIISVEIEPLFYQSFYLYLYGMSFLFLTFAYCCLLKTGQRHTTRIVSWMSKSAATSYRCTSWECMPRTPPIKSFYLRVGALVFGVGALLYSCLEFGQYFEMPPGVGCSNILTAITPASRFVFSFVQLYLVFISPKVRTDRYVTAASFGLMHMVATNICVWLSVLMEETKHELEISVFEPEKLRPPGFRLQAHTEFPYDPWSNQSAISLPSQYGMNRGEKRLQLYMETANTAFKALLNLTGSPHNYPSCRSRTSIGVILQEGSAFLYPCIVESSLICAALLYVSWEQIGQQKSSETPDQDAGLPLRPTKRQQFTVDCRGATIGLFVGLLVVLMTIISLVLFFVWIWREEYYLISIFQAYVVEIIIYSTTGVALCVAYKQLRRLRFDYAEGSRLDDLLLIISQMGVYVFPTFILISSQHTISRQQIASREDICGLVTASLEITQSTVQTVFLLDATRRRSYKPQHVRNKPGREFVTFLLVCNFSLWAIDSMEAWRQQLYPQQLQFYGTWAWTIITHISMPLTIFYRFHSSACLSEVWKSSYKLRTPQLAEAGV